jgi:hypothetical protein
MVRIHARQLVQDEALTDVPGRRLLAILPAFRVCDPEGLLSDIEHSVMRLKRLNLTEFQHRDVATYEPGQIVEFPLCLYWPLGTVVIAGPKVLDFYAGFCAHRATCLKADGKDIKVLNLILGGDSDGVSNCT